jgi:hypothetical protein
MKYSASVEELAVESEAQEREREGGKGIQKCHKVLF